VVASLKWLSRNYAVAQPASAEGSRLAEAYGVARVGVARPRHSSTAKGGGFLAKASNPFFISPMKNAG